MQYEFTARVEAVQFSGRNAQQLSGFIKVHAHLEHLSYRQVGTGAPLRFDATGAFDGLTCRDGDWIVDFDGRLMVIANDYFTTHFKAVD